MSAYVKIEYKSLNSRQQENYNFQKVAALLADYGFNCLRLSDDWQGADFIACHIDGQTFLKVQLKGRLTIDKKYVDKGIHIAFLHGGSCYLYPHDEVLASIRGYGVMNEDSARWGVDGIRNWPQPPAWAITMLAEYRH